MGNAAPPVSVGVDVAKHRLAIHLRPSGERPTNDHGDEEETAALVGRLVALAPTLVVLEGRTAAPFDGGPKVRLAAALAENAFVRGKHQGHADIGRRDRATVDRDRQDDQAACLPAPPGAWTFSRRVTMFHITPPRGSR